MFRRPYWDSSRSYAAAVRPATTQRRWTYAVLPPRWQPAPSSQGRQAVRPCPVSREAKPQPVRWCGDSKLIAWGAASVGRERRAGSGRRLGNE